MDNPIARVRLDATGKVAVEVTISPDADPDDLVTSQAEDASPDSDVLGQVKGSRAPRWVELAGG